MMLVYDHVMAPDGMLSPHLLNGWRTVEVVHIDDSIRKSIVRKYVHNNLIDTFTARVLFHIPWHLGDP
jgi:hypothetical protein